MQISLCQAFMANWFYFYNLKKFTGQTPSMAQHQVIAAKTAGLCSKFTHSKIWWKHIVCCENHILPRQKADRSAALSAVVQVHFQCDICSDMLLKLVLEGNEVQTRAMWVHDIEIKQQQQKNLFSGQIFNTHQPVTKDRQRTYNQSGSGPWAPTSSRWALTSAYNPQKADWFL